MLTNTGICLGMSVAPSVVTAGLWTGDAPGGQGLVEVSLAACGAFVEDVSLLVESGPVSTIAWAHSKAGGSGANTVFTAPTSGGHLTVTIDMQNTQTTHRLKAGAQHRLQVSGGTLSIDLRQTR